MKQIEIARMGAPPVRLTQSLINGRSRISYLVNCLNLTSGQPWTYVQVVRQQNELGIPKRTTVSVEPWYASYTDRKSIFVTKIPVVDPFYCARILQGLQDIRYMYRYIIRLSKNAKYRKTSNISRTLVGNKIVDNSDVVGASPVGAAPTTSSFST